ncbi:MULTISPECIES: ABC transporter ATP-binding protein [unclassified Leifsonia]|uniref:ABC transporter ATP-binding protein n=1 Tax=unclassified Leifsonia TaxID=2663824 RepID=UPI0009E74734|nr:MULTISPECIES: ABC transporter ATP-binding protein [unclassified Leifsonia]
MEKTETRVIDATDTGEPDVICSDLVRIFTAQGVEVQALQGLNLRLDRGELVALIGASGSGKSTLLGILSGLDVPTAGVARVAGHDLLALGRRERVAFRRRSVGFVWQQTGRNLLPYLTAAENVAAALAVAGARGDRDGRVRDVLEVLDVTDVADRRPSQMSGGQQQRVAIAVAIANEPRVLLADEPTGELDEATSASVLEAMRSVNERLGVTTLIVTHDPTVSEHVARTVQIRDGRTSTEVLRSTRTDEHGAEQAVAEEFAVLDRVGRLQLPHDFVGALGLRDRVRLSLEPDHVAVRPGQEQRQPAIPPTPPAAPASDPGPESTTGQDASPAPSPAHSPQPRGRHAAPIEEDRS